MSLNRQKILSISITTASKKEILEYLKKVMMVRPSGVRKPGENTTGHLSVVTPNPEQVMLARKLPWFAEILNQADIALPDGIGLVVAARVLGLSDEMERISGIDFMQILVDLAEKQGFPIALIGGRGGVALKALECLQKNRPDLKGTAIDGPEIEVAGDGSVTAAYGMTSGKPDQSESIKTPADFRRLASPVLDAIRVKGARMVFIGLGAPKQEWYMRSLLAELKTIRQLPPVMVMAVGGSFDILAGVTPRAHTVLRTLGLEWFWRLLLEPWRIWRQRSLITFLFLICLEKLRQLGISTRHDAANHRSGDR